MQNLSLKYYFKVYRRLRIKHLYFKSLDGHFENINYSLLHSKTCVSPIITCPFQGLIHPFRIKTFYQLLIRE